MDLIPVGLGQRMNEYVIEILSGSLKYFTSKRENHTK